MKILNFITKKHFSNIDAIVFYIFGGYMAEREFFTAGIIFLSGIIISAIIDIIVDEKNKDITL